MPHLYTEEEKLNIENWITHSVNLLIEYDTDLLSPGRIPTLYKILGIKELNRELHETAINHRLAYYLENLFGYYNINGYHCDIEYNRYTNQRKMVHSIQNNKSIEVRPDILVHKRLRLDEQVPHLLIVEAKKHGIIKKDQNHVRDIMKDENYCYKFGLLISYYENNTTVNCELLTLEYDVFVSREFTIKKTHIRL